MRRMIALSLICISFELILIPGIAASQLLEKEAGYSFEAAGFLSLPGALAYDQSRHRLAIADNGRDIIYVVDLTDKSSQTLGENEMLSNPTSMAFDQYGDLFITQGKYPLLLEFKYGNDYADTIRLDSISTDRQIKPTRISIDSHGLKYICDRDAAIVYILNLDNTLLFKIARQLKRPDGITVLPSGEILVADKGLDPILVFSPRGGFERRLSRPESPTAQFSFNASGLAIDQRGWIYTLDLTRSKIIWFDPTGVNRVEWAPEASFFPEDIAIDRYDNIYISERGSGRVRIFTRVN
jgi:hypothetical protein